jgi:hypothetical protein
VKRLVALVLIAALAGCDISRENWCALAARATASLERCTADNTCASFIGGAASLAGVAAEAKVHCEWKDTTTTAGG